MRNVTQEKLVLSQMYDNTADSVKFLPFFFQDKKELRRFFNQFGGKTLVLPDTYEEFWQYLLRSSEIPDDNNRQGIDEQIHNRTKERIIESYINLFASLEDVIKYECGDKGK